ncbi:PLP-dependent aminotransferase family protein [Paenibacillus sp. Y412MC10]|uniref:aminotransferase-like domain-containing protein n=1 Tax=Geobacillus sp. (strain Y412MC10) TaxID=481743 RepID=UPI00164361A7|nr:PLP-dependent aminotransferase family protein [Paenibacillus sp. Y412MC10]
MGNLAYPSRFSNHLPPPSIGGTKSAEPEHVHLSYGFPASDLLPIRELNEAANAALHVARVDLLHYSGAQGPVRVKSWVLNRVRKFGLHAEGGNFLPVFGAIQGIDLTARILINPGDEVWVEAPTFFNALQSFRAAGAHIRSFPVDEEGLQVNRVEEALQKASAEGCKLPKFIYVMPTFQNPTGSTLPIGRRRQLAQLAKDYDVYILEDDAYAELSFNGTTLPAVYSFAPERVIYVSTFSKTLGPGLRLGWVIAPEEIIQYMATLSLGSQLNPFTQEIVGELLEHYDFDRQVERLSDRYRSRRDTMIRVLHEELGSEIQVSVPDGGFFIWVTFGEHVDVNAVAPSAHRRGVSFVSGNAFFNDGKGARYLRLCFSHCSEEQIRKGIRSLAEAYYSIYSG